MRFKRLDLNLLVVLEALLRERSVSKAAVQLNLSQPAVSSALGRLREYFKDDILVVHGKKMVPTAHALSIEPMLLKALGDIEALIATSTIFDAATTQRVFRISVPEHLAMVLLVPLVAEIEKLSPGLKVEIVALSADAVGKLETGEIDFLIAEEQLTCKKHPRHLLFEEHHVVVGWKKNPVFRGGLTEEKFFSCGQILMLPGHALTLGEKELRELNRRCVEVVCPSFSVVPWMLQDSARLAVMQERVAKVLARTLPLAVAPLPYKFPPVREMVQYHSARDSDGGIQWLLQRIMECAAALA